MKDPFLSRRKKSNRAKKLELVCSFNGAFRPRPPSGDLRYTGGETRIITLVDRNIGFSRLKSKISELLVLRSNNGALSFSLKYQLPVEDDNEPPPPPLVLIASDDDVRCMIDEFDKLESRGMPTRLRIFVCHECDDDGFVNCVETTENLNGGCGFGGDTKVSRAKFFGESVNGFRFSSRDSMTHLCGCEFGGDEVENSATDVNGVRCSDDSLRKMVWKHLLAKQLDQIRSFRSASGLAGKGFLSENQKYNRFKHSVSSNRATNGGGRYSFDRPYGSKDNLTGVDGRGVPQLQARNPIQCHFAPKDLLTGSSIDEKHDLSLCNLSLSSSKEVEPSACSFTTGNHVSEALPWPQSKPANLMDEEHISSGPQVETSNRVSACDSSFHNAAKSGKMDEQKEEMQQDHLSSLSSEEKADAQEFHICSKKNGRIPSDFAAIYAHLASRELQTIKSSDLEYIKELGSGTYGTVFYGKWKGCDVAIKKLKPSCFTDGAPAKDRLIADFWKEARLLGQLHHPHIMAFYGVVTDGPLSNLATVTEYMVNGSLKQVLRRKDRTIDRRKRLIIAMDAAFGMEYLHEKNIVHFDLKSHNFLVNMRDPQRPVCKIGDLGLSKIKQRTMVSGGVRGTIPWMAPELFNNKKNMVTEKVDVYSFGIVMWELLTGEEPYGKKRSEEILAGIIEGNLRPEIPMWCDPGWRSLMERCWSSDPDSRPAFSDIAKELRAMSAAMNIK